MIKDKGNSGAFPDKLNSNWEVTPQDAKIKRKTILFQQTNVLNEGSTPCQVVRLSVQHPPNPFEVGMPYDLLQVGLEAGFLRSPSGHHPFQRIVLIR
jgi:hypothetical protein